jgi:hypothetical protein
MGGRFINRKIGVMIEEKWQGDNSAANQMVNSSQYRPVRNALVRGRRSDESGL